MPMIAAGLRKIVLGGMCIASGMVGAHAADLPDTIERVKPSIVAIGTHAKLRSPQFILRGTGFAVGDGTLIATNAHVLPDTAADPDQASLVLISQHNGDKRLRSAHLVISDPQHDLALLRVEGSALPALTLGQADSVREGQAIALTGFPIGGALGFSPVTHRGIVAAITPIALPMGKAGQLNDAAIRRLRSDPFPIFQLDATAYPGNSGGPMFSAESGEVLGVINMVFVKESKEAILEKPSGISYAIPVRHLAALLNRVASQPNHPEGK